MYRVFISMLTLDTLYEILHYNLTYPSPTISGNIGTFWVHMVCGILVSVFTSGPEHRVIHDTLRDKHKLKDSNKTATL